MRGERLRVLKPKRPFRLISPSAIRAPIKREDREVLGDARTGSEFTFARDRAYQNAGRSATRLAVERPIIARLRPASFRLDNGEAEAPKNVRQLNLSAPTDCQERVAPMQLLIQPSTTLVVIFGRTRRSTHLLHSTKDIDNKPLRIAREKTPNQ